MDNKHFIWIVPLILVIGFVLGLISGFKIPKDVKFGIDPEYKIDLEHSGVSE